jgi:site-specific DNA-methyltransferase (adenine-specific)
MRLTSKLALGDCLEEKKNISDGSVDLVLCDLPYGTTACKWDFVIDPVELWRHYCRVCKANAAMVFTASQPFTTTLISSNLKDFRYGLVWEKPQGTNPFQAKIAPMKCHEDILVFYQRKPTYNPQMTQGKPYGGFSSETATIGEVYGSAQSKHRANPEGTRYPRSVLRFAQERGGLHPTQKPVPLMEYLVLTYSNPGEIVLDNCMGSGTTGVACHNTGRNFIGIEKDPTYYETAKNRIEALYE